MQVTDGRGTCARVESPSDREVCFFFLCAGDVMAACTCVRSPAGGSNSLPDGSVHVGRGTVQLHDVTGEVQQARLIVAVQRFANCELPCWTRIVNLKRFNLETKKSKPRFRVDMISRGRGEIPPVLGHRKPLVRGMG